MGLILFVVRNFLFLLLKIFFRTIGAFGASKIPKKGAVIFVAAPHANQFVDPIILLKCVKVRHDVGFLTAQKSMDRKYVGKIAKAMKSIGVQRPQVCL